MLASQWRLHGFLFDGDELVLTRAALCDAAGQVLEGGVLTCTHAPSVGSVAELAGGVAVRWPRYIAAAPGFALEWTFSSDVDASCARIGGESAATCPYAFDLSALSGGRWQQARFDRVPFPGVQGLTPVAYGLFDRGYLTWERLSGVTGGTQGFFHIGVCGTGQHILIAAYGSTAARPLVSRDYGKTFVQVNPGASGSEGYNGCAVSANGQIMVVVGRGASSRVAVSYDSGATWVVQSGFTSYATGFGQVGMSQDGQTILIAQRGSTDARMYLTKNAGETWSTLSPTPGSAAGFLSAGVSGDGLVLVAGAFGSAGSACYISRDGGGTWAALPLKSGAGGWYSAALSFNGATILMTTGSVGGGLFLSKDAGVTWSKVSEARALGGDSYEGCAVSADGASMATCESSFASVTSVALFSVDGGDTWVKQVIGDVGPSGPVGVGLAGNGRLGLVCGRGAPTSPALMVALPPLGFKAPKFGAAALQAISAVKGELVDDGLVYRRGRVLFGGDAEFGGRGAIYGTVERSEVPANVPLIRRVRLHRSRDGMLVREVWSKADGSYEFTEISGRYEYEVIAWDHELQFRSVVANNLVPEVMS